MSTNTWIGIGNLTKDPDVKYTQGQNPKAVCRFSIAINDGYGDKQEVNYINIAAFGKVAETCGKYLSKGKKVCVTGRIKTGSYTSQRTGEKVYTTDIIASSVEFLSPQSEQPQQNYAPQQTQPQEPAWSNQDWGQQTQQQMFPQTQTVEPPKYPQGFEKLDGNNVPF